MASTSREAQGDEEAAVAVDIRRVPELQEARPAVAGSGDAGVQILRLVTGGRMKPKVGDRVRCTGPLDDGSLGMNASLVGVEGTVDWLGEWMDMWTNQIGIHWDNGSRLMLLDGDPFVVIASTEERKP
jgi:hypothetical protein